MATIVEMINPLTGLPEQVDKLDHTAQEIDDAVGRSLPGAAIDASIQAKPNPNLLDNWYFGNPVDQRQGRVVVPNTTYYSDNTLATAAGTTSAYVTAYRYATGTSSGANYASFKLEDKDTAPTYYATPGNVVRGYTGAGYGIDRWTSNGCASIVTDNGIKLIFNAGSQYRQILDNYDFLDGLYVTASVLFEDGTFASGSIKYNNSSSDWDTHTLISTKGVRFILAKAQGFTMYSDTANQIELKAAKLELGSQQTLAHQDADGNWVLNEIPDYGEQLARCQRYAIDLNPNRQKVPIIGTVNVDGTSMWLSMPIPTSLRTTPVISNSRGTVVVSNDSGSSEIAFGNDVRVSSGMITIAMSGSTKRDGFAYMLDGGGTGIPTALLSADL